MCVKLARTSWVRNAIWHHLVARFFFFFAIVVQWCKIFFGVAFLFLCFQFWCWVFKMCRSMKWKFYSWNAFGKRFHPNVNHTTFYSEKAAFDKVIMILELNWRFNCFINKLFNWPQKYFSATYFALDKWLFIYPK